MTTQIPRSLTPPLQEKNYIHTCPLQPSAPPINPEFKTYQEHVDLPKSIYPPTFLVNQNMSIIPYEHQSEGSVLELLKDKSVYKIASFNAGGPGVLSASCLQHIMKTYNDSLGTHKKPSSIFDLFSGGGGAGSILASSYALGDSTEKIITFLHNDFPKAFVKRHFILRLSGSRYEIKSYFKVLKNHFKEKEIKDCKTDLILYSTKSKSTSPKPKYYAKIGKNRFITYKRDKGGIQLHNEKIYNACLASSANTYYFPALNSKESHSGYYTSNPSKAALQLARASLKTKPYRKILILNFQTGSSTSTYSLFGNSFEDKITLNSDEVDTTMNLLELDDNKLIYIPINIDLENTSQKCMDSVSENDYESLKKLGEIAAKNLLKKKF